MRKNEMTNTVLLNNIDHRDLKIVPQYGEAFGDAVNQTVVFPTEFAEVQKEYPILFRKDEDGKYQSVALLGFDKAENLFLDGSEWHAHHVPVFHQRGPFMIGFQKQEIDGEMRREPVVYVENPWSMSISMILASGGTKACRYFFLKAVARPSCSASVRFCAPSVSALKWKTRCSQHLMQQI